MLVLNSVSIISLLFVILMKVTGKGNQATLAKPAGIHHWLYIIMDDMSPLPTAVQKWSQNISFVEAAILLECRHLEPAQ